MKCYKSAYFDQFHCIAAACPDSCCQQWEVVVDPTSADVYRRLSGPLGADLRRALREEDGTIFMTIQDGRCPMWRRDSLCRIQAELGESALCQTCRNFPRLTHDYGDFQEWDLELSCPEAARLILNAPPAPLLEQPLPGGSAPEYDTEAMSVLLASRETMLTLLSDTTRPVGHTLTIALLYGYQVQSRLDGGEALPFDPEAALSEAFSLAVPASMDPILDFFQALEVLTPQWKARLQAPSPAPWDIRTLALARYLVRRYWLQAVSDYDLYSRVKFTILSCLLVKALGGDFLSTAQLFSKEIENDPDNLDAILDAAYTHPALTNSALLSLLLAP